MAYKGFDLTGKVSLVTGGNGGIGFGMADAMAEAGADVCIWGTNPAKNAAAADKLRRHGRKVHAQIVDVGDESLERRGRRNGVHPVEGVGDVDDPVLFADRDDRLRERHAARDLLLEEEADHLALVVGLHLLARDHDQLPPVSALHDLERSPEDVVVGDCDRP